MVKTEREDTEANMKKDDIFGSLSRMAEEYDRLVSPMTKLIGIYDRWNGIDSPLLRVA